MPNDHGSSARVTNGSYIVPIGTSGWPSRDHVAPSSPSSPTRLPSAIPSSMCWPAADSVQRRIRFGVVGEPVVPVCEVQIPTRLIQPPRLVDEADVRARPSRRGRRPPALPERGPRGTARSACCVDELPRPAPGRAPSGPRRRACDRTAGALESTAGRAARLGLRRPGVEHRPRVVGVGSQPAGELAALRRRSSSAEWLPGSPSDWQTAAP